MDARLLEVSAEVDKRMAPGGRRQTVVSAPQNDDAAQVFYNGFFWAIAAGKPGNLPRSFAEETPPLPADIVEVTAKVSPSGKSIDAISTAYLSHARDEGGVPDEKRRDFAKGVKTYERYQPVLRYLRRGIQSGHADWGPRWDRGHRMEGLHLLYCRAGANLLAYDALLKPPREAIEVGLEIVAWGQDLTRHGDEWTTGTGLGLTRLGCESLIHTLGQPGLKPQDCQRVIEALGTYEPLDPRRVLGGVRLRAVVSLLELSGRPLDPTTSGPVYFRDGTIERRPGGPPYFDLAYEREIATYEEAHARCLEVLEIPEASGRMAAYKELYEQLRGEGPLPFPMQLPAAAAWARHCREAFANVRLVQLAAAARAVQLETGAFPASTDELAETLGEALIDPAADTSAPLGYRVEGKTLEVWEAGENGVSEGGPKPEEARRRKKSKGGKKRKGGKKSRTSRKAAWQQLVNKYGKRRLSSDDRGFRLRLREE